MKVKGHKSLRTVPGKMRVLNTCYLLCLSERSEWSSDKVVSRVC